MQMQSINQEYAEAMIFKIFYEQFMNQVQIIQNLYGKFDPDTLALLAELDPSKKYAHVQNIRKAYVVVILDIIDTEALIERNLERIQRLNDEGKETKAKRWEEANKYNYLWLRKLKGLLVQAKSGYAFFRSLAMVESFEQKKKRGGILGLGKDALGELKQKLAIGRKQAAQPPELTPPQQAALEDAVDVGIDAVKQAQKDGTVTMDGEIP